MRYGDILPAGFQVPKSAFWIKKDLEAKHNPFGLVVVRPGDTVMDCGGFIGTFAAAVLEQQASTVVVYEASPKNASLLRANLEPYGDTAQIEEVALVAGDRRSVTLTLSGFSGANSIVPRGRAAEKRSIEVPAVNFRAELRRIKPQVLKLDIEGAEYDILDSIIADDLASVECIFVEFHPYDDREQRIARVTALILEAGFLPITDRKRAAVFLRPTRVGLSSEVSGSGANGGGSPPPEEVFIPPTREWAVADLIDAAYNPRAITDRQLADLQASIEDFGLVEDVVVNVHPERRGVVVGGHQKLKILRAKGVARVPCKEVSLSEDRERELNLRLNANGGQFDSKLLVEGGFTRDDLESWGLSLEDLAAFDKAATAFDPEGAGGGDWRATWAGMPEFESEDVKPFDSINVQFRNEQDRHAFLALLGEDPERQKSIWYPRMEYLKQSTAPPNPEAVEANAYPIYVISKGRWETPLTARALETLGISYRVVVEPQEAEAYGAALGAERVLALPFSNLGQGSIPARNWVWEHALAGGAARHWILDDNMDGFYRLNRNLKVKVVDQNPFLPVEQFTDRYQNVALAGMNYEFFADRRSKLPPYLLNTRVYSCILIKNNLPYRWRGRYNEDTDLSLRALKDGWCTVLFNAFLAKKMPTMKMTGGNTDELYQGDGRLHMAQSLVEQHPDCVRLAKKWGRWQHHVSYRAFKRNQLLPVDAAPDPSSVADKL